MRRVLWGIYLAIGVLFAVVIIAINVLFFQGQMALSGSFDVDPVAVNIPSDGESIERGKHLADAVAGCTSCHGANLEGDLFFDEPGIAIVHTPNLTSGSGGVGREYTDVDWVRAIRHGVRPDGEGLIIMPSKDFFNLSDADLGAIIAFVKSVPPTDHESPPPYLEPLGRLLIGAGQFGEVMTAREIDHTGGFPTAPERGVTAEYGKYLVDVAGCDGCHGPDLAGGSSGNAPPGSPPPLNLTPGGEMGGWTDAHFVSTMRTGINPGGYELDSEFMPWEVFGKMTDDELGAVFRYLQSLPARETP